MKCRWMFGLLLGVCACENGAPGALEPMGGGDTGTIEATGERWEPSDTEDPVPEPPIPDSDVDDCVGRWLDTDEPTVLIDAELDCRLSGFGRYGLSVSSLDGAAVISLADSRGGWVVRAGGDAIEPLRGGPERARGQRMLSTVDDNGDLVVSTVSYTEGRHMWQVWRLEKDWQLLAAADVGPSASVFALDSTATGEIAAWLDVDGAPMVARASAGWRLEPALELERAVVTSRALTPQGVEVAAGFRTDPETGLTETLARVAGGAATPLEEPAEGPVEVLLLSPTQGRSFPVGAADYRATRGTQGDLGVSEAGGWVNLPGTEMASARCPFDWGSLRDDDDCEDCSEEGSGRFGQAVSVARLPGGELLVAYVHADLDRRYSYHFWCTHPDGAYCSCDTLISDNGSAFGLRLVVVRDDGSMSTLLSLPLDVEPNGRESSAPGEVLALDVRDERAAIAIRLADAPLRALVVDVSGIDSLSD